MRVSQIFHVSRQNLLQMYALRHIVLTAFLLKQWDKKYTMINPSRARYQHKIRLAIRMCARDLKRLPCATRVAPYKSCIVHGRRKWSPCVSRIYRAPLELAVEPSEDGVREFSEAIYHSLCVCVRKGFPFLLRVCQWTRIYARARLPRARARDMRSCRNSPGDVNSLVLPLSLSCPQPFFLCSLSLSGHPPLLVATLRVDFRVHPLIAGRSTSHPISLAIVAAASSDNILQSGEGDHPYEERRPSQWRSSNRAPRQEAKLRVLNNLISSSKLSFDLQASLYLQTRINAKFFGKK